METEDERWERIMTPAEFVAPKAKRAGDDDDLGGLPFYMRYQANKVRFRKEYGADEAHQALVDFVDIAIPLYAIAGIMVFAFCIFNA
jgi:hypothetical protein